MRGTIASVSVLLLSGPLSCLGCPNKCSRNGECNSQSICECFDGFSGGDCSIRLCPSGHAFSDMAEITDTAHKNAVCSGRGTCVSGTCRCDAGFTGTACERTKCHLNCNYHGQCVSMRHLAETTRNHESKQYTYSNWDADKLYGCVCDLGYAGFDCSLQVCPSGDDPLTTSDTAQEIQLIKCIADNTSGGRIVLYFDGRPSTSIHVDASKSALKKALESIPLIEEVHITYSEGHVLCRNDGNVNIVSITFTSNFGPLPPLVAESFGMEPASVIEIAADDSYGMLSDHNDVEYFHVKGDKENDECSNRGICDHDTGSCDCFNTNGDEYAGSDGYGGSGNRGDCGHALTEISTCPGDPYVCSDHGFCDPITKRCLCADGFTGGDCSLRSCEKGLSWFNYPSSNGVAHDEEVECSNMGQCIRKTGECFCNEGFFGAACEYMGCLSKGSEQSCNGHGTCLSMRDLALHHDDAPIAYGSDPNEAATWDADRIFGCLCDDGFEGFDCSLHTCPKGSNALTCSGKGICDQNTGECKCFVGWGSSDGAGNMGPNNDCGHRLKLRGYP